MSEFELRPVRLDSAAPYGLCLTVEPMGRDVLCRVSGGAAHVGAVALAEWREGRAHTRCLDAEGHREAAIARHAAHALCAAARRSVACVAGIHFDGVTRSDIEEISRQAYDMARRAARIVRDARLRDELRDPAGTFGRVAARRSDFQPRVEEFFTTPPEALLGRWRAEIEAIRRDRFADSVRLFAPLYLSSACTNDCVYCGFRRSSDFARTRLEVSQAVRQARELAGRGIRALDLVTGEIPTDPFVDYVGEATAAILEHTAIGRIHLNVGALSIPQYARLRASGAEGVHVYQETYDSEAFFGVHRAGGKRDLASRLEAPRRAATAGFRCIGLGVLLGIAEPARDLAALAAHAALLGEEFPDLEFGFSLPRVQGMEADPDYAPSHPVSDADFVRAMLFLRLEFPDAHLTLTTRESPDMRDALLRCGVTRMSAGVSTAPGGYVPTGEWTSGDIVEPREQFRISDVRTVTEMEARIREAGLVPSYE